MQLDISAQDSRMRGQANLIIPFDLPNSSFSFTSWSKNADGDVRRRWNYFAQEEPLTLDDSMLLRTQWMVD